MDITIWKIIVIFLAYIHRILPPDNCSDPALLSVLGGSKSGQSCLEDFLFFLKGSCLEDQLKENSRKPDYV